MFLSEFIGKPVKTQKKFCGICRGLGICLKSFTIKHLICSGVEKNSYEIFYIPIFAIKNFSSDEILLYRRHVSAAVSTNKFFCGKPIYSQIGTYLGIATDLEFNPPFVNAIITDTGTSIPTFLINAISDAILLKKKPNYPLGQQIKETTFLNDKKTNPFVSKAILKNAIYKGELITLTTSLSPFIIQ